MLFSALAACAVAEPDDPCRDASERVGATACVLEVPTEEAWAHIAVADGQADAVRSAKYLSPARPDARLPTLFLDANTYPLHFELLADGFEELFPDLSPADYIDLILPLDDREFHAGRVSEFLDGGGARFGFTLWDDPDDPEGAIGREQVEAVHDALGARFGVGPLSFVPSSDRQSDDAATWTTDVPVFEP